MTDQPLDDREDAEAEPPEDLLETQEGKGYGTEEREREESPPDE